MFYVGDLQSGIDAAVQQSKLVTCFVGDNGEESTIWENVYLKDATLGHLLSEKTVLLRLHAGSQEAGFLSALYPIPKIPTLIIIHNSQLKEYLAAGIPKPDFLRRLKAALSDGHENSTSVASDSLPTPALEHESDQRASSTSSQNEMPSEQGPPSVVRELLAERSARLEIKKRDLDIAEKAERAAKAIARKEALKTAGLDPETSKKAADMKYALMQKSRQDDARNERARILRRIEDDKAERRVREALRKEQDKAAIVPTESQASIPVQPKSSNLRRSHGDEGSACALQVRLFDGTTIRSRFSPQATLRKDIRQWIDGQRVGEDVPYTFKQLLTPNTNKSITISEEEDPLQSLGLSPSATLVLVPVKDYTSAYEGGLTSYISRGVYAGFGLVSSGINIATGTLAGLSGGGVGPEVIIEPENRSSQRLAGENAITFQEQEGAPEEHQLYNGNALNFEPRRDNEGKED